MYIYIRCLTYTRGQYFPKFYYFFCSHGEHWNLHGKYISYVLLARISYVGLYVSDYNYNNEMQIAVFVAFRVGWVIQVA